MQKDAKYLSTSGHMTHNQDESQIKSFRCSHCTLIFKSNVYLFEHLNKVHGLDIDVALRDAGLKNNGTNKANTDINNISSLENNFVCQHCDFKTCSWDVHNKHATKCRNVTESLIIPEDRETKVHKETAGATDTSPAFTFMPTSETKCTDNSSKDVKTYKRPLQTITKYFVAPASSGSNGKLPVKLADNPLPRDGTKGTLLLQQSPSDTSPNSSGVLKVTAKPTIDVLERAPHCFLIDNRQIFTDLRSPELKEQVKEAVPKNVGKRTSDEISRSSSAKRAKLEKKDKNLQETANKSKPQSRCNTNFSLEFSEDEEEKKVNVIQGDMDSPDNYSCKHCDYSDVSIGRLATHYQNDHPYIRHNPVYIQDPSDRSATFRCLDCPVEFLNVADLKTHYMENHPEAPSVFTRQSHELHLVFKCFVCLFTASAMKTLKEHYVEKHPTHKVENSLMYCRYSVTSCQEAPFQLQTQCNERAHTPCKEVKNTPSPKHPASSCADVVLYHCNKCKFSHKSIIVMHVHYQKCHPDETVTIDKIKQSALVKSPDKAPNSVTEREKSSAQKNISDSSKEIRPKAELSQEKNISLSSVSPKHTPEAFKTHSESVKTKKVGCAEERCKAEKSPTKHKKEMSSEASHLCCSPSNKLFYCQFCSYSSTYIKSVIGHHNAKHSAQAPADTEAILCHSAEMQKKILQSEVEASPITTSSDPNTSKHVEEFREELQDEDSKTADATLNAYACAENLFYCHKCNYGNPFVKGVLNHQAQIHQGFKSNREYIVKYSTLICEEIQKSKSQAKQLSFATALPLPLLNEGDEDRFFCHFCNYRQNTVNQVMRHYLKKHRGFLVSSEQVRLYTSMVLKQTKTTHLKTTACHDVNHVSFVEKVNIEKTKKLGKVSASPSIKASQKQRNLQCHKCSYKTHNAYLLKRHVWKTHKANHSVTDALRVCFKRGTLQSGYHCDLCVFSHKKATVVHKHYEEHHPGRRLSLKYVTTRLYAGPETCLTKNMKLQTKRTHGDSDDDSTEGSLPSQKSGQSETKTYSCRACSFKGSSVSSITRHYRAVHPWSVKEDGSVLDVINSKKPSANRQVDDHNKLLVSFDTYQAPLKCDSSPGSSHEAASSTMVQCPYCPASFQSQRGLSTHCGMKHQDFANVNLEEKQKEQVQIKTRIHVFKCPHCTYINTNYQGVLTHCQMRHPALASRADSLYLDEAYLHNWEDSLKSKGPGLRRSGYMCETCPRVCATLEKLNQHCEKGHHKTAANTVPNKPKLPPKPAIVSKIKQYKIYSNHGSVSKASFLSNNTSAVIRCPYCTYKCSTKLALSRHFHVCHKNASVSKAQSLYSCTLCSSFYLGKTHLASHYIKKHGKEAYLKCFAPLYKQIHEKSAPVLSDQPLTQRPENTPETCESSTTTEENKILVYKCPTCSYVNASHHGILTHCQMKHPDLIARADELQTEEILAANIASCTLGKGSNERGYMCKKCLQIHVSLKNFKLHCERDHDQTKATASENSAEIEKQPDHSSCSSLSLTNMTLAASTADGGLSHHLDTPKTSQSVTQSVQNKELLYKCHICSYTGSCRKYLYCHYKNTHKLDGFTTHKLLEKYKKYKHSKFKNPPEAKSEERASVNCKICPNLEFNSSQLLVDHYSTFHTSNSILDFIVLSKASKKSTGLYKCSHCQKQMNGIRKLCLHLDQHREKEKEMAKDAETKTSLVTEPTSEPKSIELFEQHEVPTFETVEEMTKNNMTPVQTFTLPPSPMSSPSNTTDAEPPDLESRDNKHTCGQCRRSFMSLKGLRSHERSHAALAAIRKRVDNVSTAALKHNINKYVIYKAGTIRPFLCSFCSYRTTVMGLWRSHFMKQHLVNSAAECTDGTVGLVETDHEDEDSFHRADKEAPNSSEEPYDLAELDKGPHFTEKSLYLEPPDVQRQLNHYSLRAGATSKVNMQETTLPENSLLYCEVCNFNTEHLSSMRRHYLNRHGKKMLRCKDCDFVTGLRKTLEMHMETGHSTCHSEPTQQKYLRCPFCLYQTKNKNNMIDHIVLHREERIVPIEVRRSKLSRYLQGIVFRCHKCTFTSSSAENLRLHMMRHDDVKPYKCRLCYFDCPQLSDLEAHLSDQHQVLRNHELVGQISLDLLEAREGRRPEVEPLSNMEQHSNDRVDVKTEEFVTDSNETPSETHTKNPAENNIWEKITIQLKKASQTQGQDDKNGSDKSPTKTAVSDSERDNTKPNTAVQDKQDQETQEQAGIMFLLDAARGQGIENIEEQNDREGNTAKIQFKDCNFPDKERGQGNEKQVQTKLVGHEDKSKMFTRQRNEAAEESSQEAHKLHIKSLKHRTLNIEARVEHDILRRILLLDKDGSSHKIQTKVEQDITVKNGPEVIEMLQLDEQDSTVAQNLKKQVDTEVISELAKKSHRLSNHIMAQEHFISERHLLTPMPNCGQLKKSHEESLRSLPTNCKEEQVQNHSEDLRERYGEMPVLENEYLKEEIFLGCCKEEDESDHLEQQQDKEEEMITEDDGNKCAIQEHWEGDEIKEAENPLVPKGAPTVTEGAATERKRFTCELCGRNLMNSSELERHVIRHGM